MDNKFFYTLVTTLFISTIGVVVSVYNVVNTPTQEMLSVGARTQLDITSDMFNPSATSTPTANSLILADGGGNISDGWLSSGVQNKSLLYSETFTAGEDLTAGNVVRAGLAEQTDDLRTFINQTTNNTDGSLGTTANYEAQSFTTASNLTEKLKSVTFAVKYAGGTPGSSQFRVRLYSDNSGQPGSEITNVTSNVPFSGSPQTINHTFTFSTAQTLSTSTVYWISVEQDVGTATFAARYQNTDVLAGGYRATSADSGSSWSQQTSNDLYMVVNYTDTAGRLYKARANAQDIADATIGFVNSTVSAGDSSVRVDHLGVVTTQSGLVAGDTYYLSNTRGTIGTSAGSVSKKIGIGLSATNLLSTLGF